ncbi:hypothetical protein LCGC14_1070040, partial [marine sediment metagenome]
MTDAKKIIGYVQGPLQFTSRDDVDERQEYYIIFDNGTLEVVQASLEPRPNILERAGSGIADMFTGGLLAASGRPFTAGGDPLNGRIENGTALSPEVQAALSTYLATQYSIRGVRNQDALKIFLQARQVERGLQEGQTFEAVFSNETITISTKEGRVVSVSGEQILEASKSLAPENTLDEELAAPRGPDLDVGGTGPTSPEPGASTDPGFSASAADADKTPGAGIDADIGPSGLTAATLEAGDFKGVQITPELLQ